LTPDRHISLPAHGGRLTEVMRHFPNAPNPIIDLSTGISPYPYSFIPPDPATLARLPEPHEESGLLTAAARTYGTTPDCIAAGPGTQALMGLLPLLIPYKHAAILSPTYSGHANAWAASGAQILEVPTLAALAEAAAPDTVCILCNPNNPDAHLHSRTDLLTLANHCARQNTRLIVDEAFADLDGQSLAPDLPHPALILLRSFGKTYGLAGLRLGFILTTPPLAHRIRQTLGPWAVSAQALAIGQQALSDTPWRQTIKTRLTQDAARMRAFVTSANLTILGQTRLFTLLIMPNAHSLWATLCQQGLVTRAFPNQPDRLRIGIPPNEDAWQRLENALTSLSQPHALTPISQP